MSRKTSKSGQKIAKRFSKFPRHISRAGDTSVEHIQENIVDRIHNARRVRLQIAEWVILLLILIALAITQAFWYRESYAVDTFTSGATYTEATLGKVNSLNPLFATTNSEKAISRLLFGTLAATDYSGHTQPSLAASITPDETGKHWTIKLKDSLKWSDGEPITNADIIYTVKTIQDPKVNTAYSSNLSSVEVSEKEGVVTFSLPTAYANFDSALNFPILPSHILKDVPADKLSENTFSTAPITSGAFTYNATQAIGTEGEKVVYLNANPDNYQGKPMLDTFAIHAFLDTGKIKESINNGSVTATAELFSADDADDILNDAITEKQTAISSGVFAFLNTRSPILSKVNLRRAIQQGIDMKSLRAPLGEEFALDYPLLKSQVDLSEWPALPAYNPEESKQTIASANLPEGSEINLVTVDTGYLPNLADNLELQLKNLGFKVNKRVMSPGQDFLISVIRPRSYDILLYEVELGPSPDLFPYYHSTQATATGLNLSNYNNKLVDALILGGRSSMNPKIRATRYETFLKYWIEDVPSIAIYQANLSYHYNKNVRTFSDEDHLVYPTDRFNNVEYWAAQKITKNRTP
ncbi:hypothetical protein IJ096_01485 [Candidatus Saccharibacteria bacterium]|nr:hypothetical protein [Candidatus Saccharibacteria bacterium]